MHHRRCTHCGGLDRLNAKGDAKGEGSMPGYAASMLGGFAYISIPCLQVVPNVPVLALTATATPRVQADIVKSLGLRTDAANRCAQKAKSVCAPHHVLP